METPNITKQMILFNKEAFNNTFDALVKLQEQAEKMNSKLLDQAIWLPEDGKKAINEWTQAYKKGRDEYKKAIDESLVNLQKLFPEKN